MAEQEASADLRRHFLPCSCMCSHSIMYPPLQRHSKGSFVDTGGMELVESLGYPGYICAPQAATMYYYYAAWSGNQ